MSSHRRSTGKIVVLNEEELIQQVSMRPILYDRSLKAHRKSGLRLQYWKEVGNAMGATVDECRRRWRSLRDSFAKHYKQMNRIRDDLPGGTKRKKWVFYNQMSFLAPYLDNSSCDLDELLDDFSEDADGMLLLPTEDSTQEVSQTEDFHKDEHELPGDAAGFIKVASATSTDKDEEHEPQSSACNTSGHCQSACSSMDCDEKFLLSCVPVLRRLTTRKNALAKLKIQQILFDIEFGSECN